MIPALAASHSDTWGVGAGAPGDTATGGGGAEGRFVSAARMSARTDTTLFRPWIMPENVAPCPAALFARAWIIWAEYAVSIAARFLTASWAELPTIT